MGESEKEGGGEAAPCVQPKPESAMSRKEKRKAMKKMKRKQTRKEIALKEREEEEEEAKLQDPQELIDMEKEEAARAESVRILFEERERAWIEAMEIRKQKQLEREEDERRNKALEDEKRQIENTNDVGDDDGEYEVKTDVKWTEKEIILTKKRVKKVPERNKDQQSVKEDSDRPTSNPLPPQSEAFDDYKNGSLSARQLIETVAEQVPHFGTEQDKDHCPFHLKTGACRFGQRCSRVHFYPDKSSTLLIKNMYNGPGLTWEQDEGLEYTDEEIERCYEEFYEDVHTEFLKFGEIINFKVCINGASHLRGNVYVQYSALESAVVAHQSINGRYFAGKQISCDFINVTRWKVAICGEYVKSRYKTCSRGTACNFIHCFRNPGGDYEWADSDRPPPKYWVEKMVALFGYSDAYKKRMVEDNYGQSRNSSKMSMTDSRRHVVQRSGSRDRSYSSFTGSGRRYDKENYASKGTGDHRPSGEENAYLKDSNHRKNREYYIESDGELLDSDGNMDRDIYQSHRKKRSKQENRDHKSRTYDTESDGHLLERGRNRVTEHDGTRKSSSRQQKAGVHHDYGDCEKEVHEAGEDRSTRDGDRDSHLDSRRSSGPSGEENASLKDFDHRKKRKYYIESDGELLNSDGSMDRDIYRSHRKKRSRQEKKDHKNRTYDTESDENLFEWGRKRVTEHDGTRKSSSGHRKGVRHDYDDREKEVHEDCSSRDGGKESYRDSRKSSGHKRKVGYADVYKDHRSKGHDSDGEWSDSSNRKGDEHHCIRRTQKA